MRKRGQVNSVRTIIRLELVDNILDVKVHGRFRDAKLISNLLILIAFPYPFQNFQLAWCEIFLTHVFRYGACHVGWNMFPAG
jgi:hypothetical protein